MNWSWYVGAVSGIRVRVHGTLLLLLALVGVSEWHHVGTVRSGVAGALLLAALFGCVLLHELGHALAARRYGIGTREITLLPFGGIAVLERVPATPRQELVVALAGPAVNIVLAALLGCAMVIAPAPFIGSLFWINIALAVFNLVPAFPMDGGRVMRALLAQRLVRQRAKPRPEALSPHDTLSRPLAIFARTGQLEFPVLDRMRVVGILRHEQLSVAFARFGPDMAVGSAMERLRPLAAAVSAR